MSIYLKSGLLGAALLLCQPVCALDLVPFSHDASVLDKLTLTHTDTPELKPIPYQSFNLAAAQFLPEAAESVFANHREIDKDYNKGDCTKQNSLFTTKNCSYPYAVVSTSKCALRPGYYKECVCLPQFKLSSCPAPKYASSPECDGKFERCLCPASVSLNNPNDKCTQYCDGKCIAKSCTPAPDETDCQYGATSSADGCGGSRTVCKACTPLASESNCQYGTTTEDDGCGGKRTVCKACTPLESETNCLYGTTSVTDGCGGVRTICASCYYYDKCQNFGNSQCPSDKNCESCTACGKTNYKIIGDKCASEFCLGVDYNYTSCPENAVCSRCTVTYSSCNVGETKYKFLNCEEGYTKSGKSCKKKGNVYYQVRTHDYQCCIKTTINGYQEVYQTQWNCDVLCDVDGVKYSRGATTYCLMAEYYSSYEACIAQNNCKPSAEYGYYWVGGTGRCTKP